MNLLYIKKQNNISHEINDTNYSLNEILINFDLFDYIEKLESGIDTFIDESFENLDHKFEVKFNYILNKYLKDKTVIMIEHGGYRSNLFDRYYKFVDRKLEVGNG